MPRRAVSSGRKLRQCEAIAPALASARRDEVLSNQAPSCRPAARLKCPWRRRHHSHGAAGAGLQSEWNHVDKRATIARHRTRKAISGHSTERALVPHADEVQAICGRKSGRGIFDTSGRTVPAVAAGGSNKSRSLPVETMSWRRGVEYIARQKIREVLGIDPTTAEDMRLDHRTADHRTDRSRLYRNGPRYRKLFNVPDISRRSRKYSVPAIKRNRPRSRAEIEAMSDEEFVTRAEALALGFKNGYLTDHTEFVLRSLCERRQLCRMGARSAGRSVGNGFSAFRINVIGGQRPRIYWATFARSSKLLRIRPNCPLAACCFGMQSRGLPRRASANRN